MVVFKSIFLSSMETALNQYLELGDNIKSQLQPISGKTIAIEIQPFDWTIYFCPTVRNIQILESISWEPDTTITGSAFALGMMGLMANPLDSLFSGDVIISGDLRIGRKFQALFKQLDIQLEDPIARFTGETIARSIADTIRTGKNWGTEALESLQLNLSEYLHDETKDLPPQPELDIFFRGVDRLRSDYDRLEARINRLEHNIPSEKQHTGQADS